MALSNIEVSNMITGETPVANRGTDATTLAAARLGKRAKAQHIINNGDMDIAQRST